MKSTLAGGKVAASAAVFFIDWDDLQLNVPNPFVPGQFYIATSAARAAAASRSTSPRGRGRDSMCSRHSASRARSSRPAPMANGVAVDDNNLPYTPDYTATFGGQLSRADHVGDQRLRPRRGRC